MKTNPVALLRSALTLRGRCLSLWVIIVTLSLIMFTPAPGRTIKATAAPIPVLAYYYIWFDVSSCDRAKTDYPLLGRYSNDEPDVMRQHIQWAKAAGIDGFIVSWSAL